MNKSTFLNRVKLQGDDIFKGAKEYLSRVYKAAGATFSPASPFGQILSVISNISMLIFVYLENVASSNNMLTATSLSDIYGNAQFSGHDPYRGVAAKGEIKFRFKPGKATDFNGPFLRIMDKTKVRCLNNNLIYTLKLSSEDIRLNKNDNEFISGIIVQGEYNSQRVRGTGRAMQTFNINLSSIIDHDDIKLYVNSKLWKKYNSIYEMSGNQVEGYVVRTGLSGGIDIIFGNGYFGKAPGLGSIIEIQYIEHDGTRGILDLNGGDAIFQFMDDGIDFRGEEVDLNEFLIIQSVHSPKLGADPENTDFTKYIAPYSSKSFTLIGPRNYEYFLSRYNSFSFIDAYNTRNDEYLDDDNVTYLFILPDIERKLNSSLDYFNINEEEFTLNSEEKSAILNAISESGQQGPSSEVKIVSPVIKRYAINIIIRYFEGYHKDSLYEEIRSKLSEYFLKIHRRDKIPKSDLIYVIEQIKGIDSVNVFFTSEENEKAIKRGYYIKKYSKIRPTTPFLEEGEGNKKRYVFFNKEIIEKKMPLAENEDPNLGLDEFGDINIGENELPIIRGGWSDRNDIYFEEIPNKEAASSLSIYFKDKIEETLHNRIQSNI